MLRRILLTSAGAMALSGAAFAAEPIPAPPPPPPPPLWTGFYVGLNAGGTWSNNNSINTLAVPVFAAPTFSTELALSSALATNSIGVSNGGFIGGGQIGYNYQFGPSFVASVEADIQGIAESERRDTVFGFGTPVGFPAERILSTETVSKRVDYLGTVRGRLGWLFTPTFLVYGTGGFAYGGVSENVVILQNNTGLAPIPAGPFTSFGSENSTRGGWTAGGGVEWMFYPQWSLKVEYLFYNLSSETFALSPLTNRRLDTGAILYSSQPFARTRFEGNIVRAGINWHFFAGPPPVVAKY